MDEHLGNLSIFTHSGRPLGKGKVRYLTEQEFQAAQMYILLNCIEVKPYIDIFVNELHMANPNINDKQVDEKLEREFDKWFNKYVHNPSNNISSQFLKDLSKGPLRSVMSYNSYVVNGYKFHTKSHGSHRATMNSGVCIKGTNYSSNESDYYGQLIEVLRLEYPGLPIKRTVLFKFEINEEDVEDEEELELDSESDEECDDDARQRSQGRFVGSFTVKAVTCAG
ncbi:uncharacterized protein LOC131174601 [Hevea brasiliensis]|uniref:uncharacterized protein LOC131174601 n=1 Tax=Hevea brasiliensis TaxID=3981 RepID=UPI0025E232E5|nr:uncharacterized protein LOC131174601 [Hevea brasiliensis]